MLSLESNKFIESYTSRYTRTVVLCYIIYRTVYSSLRAPFSFVMSELYVFDTKKDMFSSKWTSSVVWYCNPIMLIFYYVILYHTFYTVWSVFLITIPYLLTENFQNVLSFLCPFARKKEKPMINNILMSIHYKIVSIYIRLFSTNLIVWYEYWLILFQRFFLLLLNFMLHFKPIHH